jgi:hypothetical protein
VASFGRRTISLLLCGLGQDGVRDLDGGAIFETPREEDGVALHCFCRVEVKSDPIDLFCRGSFFDSISKHCAGVERH